MEARAVAFHTVDEIEAMDEGVRVELIDGRFYDMATLSSTHQLIIAGFVQEIKNKLKELGKDCEVIPAPYGVYLFNDDLNFVEPDISVICDKDKIDEKGCHGAPDWVIEVVSPSSKKLDYSLKLFKYREAGVKEYWIVDPLIRHVQVRDLENDDYALYTFDDPVTCAHMPEIQTDLSEF